MYNYCGYANNMQIKPLKVLQMASWLHTPVLFKGSRSIKMTLTEWFCYSDVIWISSISLTHELVRTKETLAPIPELVNQKVHFNEIPWFFNIKVWEALLYITELVIALFLIFIRPSAWAFATLCFA